MDPRAALLILGNEGRDTEKILEEFAQEIIRQRDIINNLGRVLKRKMRETIKRPYRKKENEKRWRKNK